MKPALPETEIRTPVLVTMQQCNTDTKLPGTQHKLRLSFQLAAYVEHTVTYKWMVGTSVSSWCSKFKMHQID